jgi:hypothetical protein
MSKQIIRSTREVKVPARAAKSTGGSLDKLIQQWREALAAGNANNEKYFADLEAVKAELPPPPILMFSDESDADGIGTDNPMIDKSDGKPMRAFDIEWAIRRVRPETCDTRDTVEATTIVFFKEPRPLTAPQTALLARLQKRLDAANAYEKAIETAMRDRGWKPGEPDKTSSRLFSQATGFEKKIAAFKSRNASDLKKKIQFLFDHSDGGLDYFLDMPDMIEDVLRDALSLAADPTNFTTRGH